MQRNDLRQNSRRLLKNRRMNDRRVIPYPFGTSEWIENIKINYHAWPRHERRHAGRRSEERREDDRRQRQLSEQLQSLKKYSSLLLTREELQMIEALYKCDVD